MKSRSIVRARRIPQPPRSRRWPFVNTMSFPQTLRDAIPTLSRCWGRCLLLNSITGRSQNNELFGKRVQIKFQVEESGKLTGKFDVWMDLDLEAARGLARTLNQLADEAEQ
ncbi:MAG: hypothetical protein ABSH32_19760 [Bryobacteraceae bacterium]|jgi:hypothetical protein